MSRAFVKEPDEGAPVEGLPERQILSLIHI